MCGIGGWIAFGDQRPPGGVAGKLLADLTSRGPISSGVGWVPKWGGDVTVIKSAIPGHRLLTTKTGVKYAPEIDGAAICILHTRAPTKGKPENNKNNHPVLRHEGRYVLVHNGQVSNDDEIFEERKGERQTEVDSEALAFLMDKGESPLAAIESLRDALGSYAIAAMPQAGVDHVILFRNTSPIALAVDDRREILYFASTPRILEGALESYYPSTLAAKLDIEGLSACPTAIELEDDHYLIFGPTGCIASGGQKPDYVRAPHPKAERYHGMEYGTETMRTWGGGRQSNLGFTSEPLEDNTPTKGRKMVKVTQGKSLLPPQGAIGLKGVQNGPLESRSPHSGVIRIKCQACWNWVATNLVRERNGRCPDCTHQIFEGMSTGGAN